MRSIRWLSVVALALLALVYVVRTRGVEVARSSLPTPVVEVQVRPVARDGFGSGVASVAPEVPSEVPPVVVQHVRPGAVAVEVVDEEGRSVTDAWVVPIDCPGFVSGPPGEYAVEVGPCALVARRLDGALIARSAPVMAVVRGEEVARIVLELPSRRTGGIGIRFQPDSDGMRVTEVVPGTPADAAGLEPGDVILAVGDDSVAGMDADQFVSTMTGDEGTVVEFTVKLPTDTGLAEQTVRVTRAYLEG